MLKNMFSIESRFYKLVELVGDLLLLNLLFIVLSLPILTIGANLSALFYAFMKKIDKQDSQFFKNYVYALKMNGKQATSLWFVFLLIGIILIGDFIYFRYFVEGVWRLVAWLFAGILLYWFVLIIYVFALQSRFENKILRIVLNAMMLSVIHFGTTFLMVLILVILSFCIIFIPYQTVLYGSVFMMVIGFSVVIYLFSILMCTIFKFYIVDS
ncbi:TPA: DUF624 domain-containing protein [Streptococcus suis]|nr:DUF624 domain-containing protein [Streptococcus suis]